MKWLSLSQLGVNKWMLRRWVCCGWRWLSAQGPTPKAEGRRRVFHSSSLCPIRCVHCFQPPPCVSVQSLGCEGPLSSLLPPASPQKGLILLHLTDDLQSEEVALSSGCGWAEHALLCRNLLCTRAPAEPASVPLHRWLASLRGSSRGRLLPVPPLLHDCAGEG